MEDDVDIEDFDDLDSIAVDSSVIINLSGDKTTSTTSTTSTTTTTTTASPPHRNIYVTLIIGGYGLNGALARVETLNGHRIDLLSPPSAAVHAIGKPVYHTVYTGRSLYSCSSGYALLTPYGWIYKPGQCFYYSFLLGTWRHYGAVHQAYRLGSSLTRVGRYLVSIGGQRKRGGRSLRSVEVLDTRKPSRGWRRDQRLSLPVGVSEHCSVVVNGPTGKEFIVTGGKGRGNRVLKYSFSLQRWYSLNEMSTERRQHACSKVKLNGRSGVIVSGGIQGREMNSSSVEWLDLDTATWINFPSLNQGRRNHAITVESGKLVVVGGMEGEKSHEKYLRSKEVLLGARWETMEDELDEGREGFSLVRLPTTLLKHRRRSRRSTN